MMYIYRVLVLIIIVQLWGCGEDAYSNGVQNTPGAISITNFEIVGTSATIGDYTPIYALENNGDFSVDWAVLSNDSVPFYSAELYISEDGAFSTNDTIFYTVNCGKDANTFACQETVSDLNCNFSTSNILKCGSDAGIDITSDVSPLPSQKYILLRVCNNVGQQCRNNAIKVEFDL